MRRTRLVVLLLAATIALAGCSDDVLDELGLSEEDRKELEELQDLAQDLGEAADAAGDGEPGTDGPPVDPDWSPPGVPPPPADAGTGEDQSDHPNCPTGWACGSADYPPESDQTVRDHYEELFGRPPDSETEGQGFEEGEVTSEWDDGDIRVEVSTSRHGTFVEVYADTTVE